MNAFFEILNIKEIEEWQVEIKKKNNDPYELDELIVYIAPKKNIDFIKLKFIIIFPGILFMIFVKFYICLFSFTNSFFCRLYGKLEIIFVQYSLYIS